MANENIGEAPCSFHLDPVTAYIRRDRKGKLYLFCEKCGIISPRLEAFKAWIMANGKFYPVEAANDPVFKPAANDPVFSEKATPTPEPVPEPVREPEPEPKPAANDPEPDEVDQWMNG